MNEKTTILPILAILSVAVLIGGFAIQAADAAMVPQRGVRIGPLDISERGVQILTREVQIGIGASGVSIDSPLFPGTPR
jgi:hypothetical protein